MCKSIWDTNCARWRADTLWSLRLTPSNSTTQNLEFSPLGTLGMITTVTAHNALTFPYSKKTTFEQTKATEKCQWSRTGGCKTNPCGTLQSHYCVVPAKTSAQRQSLALGMAPQWENFSSFEKSLQVKHLVYEPLCLTSLSCEKYDPEHSSSLSLALDPSAWGS